MARSRPQKSFADYMAIAISPLLIMLMVGSLVFFLLEIGYQGNYPSQARWILFWFVLAIVLVARIGIEQGPAYASGYAAVLGAAMSLVVLKLIPSPLIVIVLLAFVWWSANKLTWDCTLIDDSVDASGQGLLQVAGLSDETADGSDGQSQERESTADKSAPDQVSAKDDKAEKKPRRKKKKKKSRAPAFVQRWMNSTDLSEKKRSQHAPGLWVMYFSLAALPVFGLGQAFLGSIEGSERDETYTFLFVYVAAAMGLLLTTSFLGLRRYLRQRKLAMPASMARAWFQTGAIVLGGVMLVAVLFPRPDAEYSVTALLERIDSTDQEASDRSVIDDDGADGEGRGGDKQSEDQLAQANDQKGEGRGKQNEDQENRGGKNRDPDARNSSSDDEGSKQQGDGNQEDREGRQANGQGEDEQGQQDNQQGKQDDQQQGRQAESETETSSEQTAQSTSNLFGQAGGWVARLLKWIIYAVIAFVVLYVIYKNLGAIQRTLNLFLARLQALFGGLFGGKKPSRDAGVDSPESTPKIPDRPFARFQNPFDSGRAGSMSETEILSYTFAALAAWGRGHGWPRESDQTVTEYAEKLSLESADLGRAVIDFARIYSRVTYGGRRMPKAGPRVLENLWTELSNSAPAQQTAEMAMS